MPSTTITPIEPDFLDDDDDGWQDMPVVREDDLACVFDEEDKKKYHYVSSAKGASAENATGHLIDVDVEGNEWRSKLVQNESEYTRLRINEEEDADEVHLRTRYLFDEDKAMTPLSQMQATKNFLTEAQRIAYVGLCYLTAREMLQSLRSAQRKELKACIHSTELWAMKIMGRLYYHMELETQEQKMIESLAQHGVQAMDLVPSLMTTHTIANPEYDPAEARRQADLRDLQPDHPDEPTHDQAHVLDGDGMKPSAETTALSSSPPVTLPDLAFQTTPMVLGQTSTASIPGVSTTLSAADEKVTLDIRWTVLCDLFLVLIADSVYDARSRVLLETVAGKLGFGWLDVVKFESRVTEALEIQEGIERMENRDAIVGQQKAQRNKRYMMLGLATLGGGLVIGLSAGLLAPFIGAGLGAAFTTIGITGTTGFLAGAGGAAVITTGGVLTGSGIAVSGMVKRTRLVGTFELMPLHNNKRVSCILTVPGFMNGIQDDVRLPFSVLDPIVGDVFSVLWEPEMIRETGSALKILTGEVLSQLGQTVLQATVMAALMSALQWPIILTKLGYLIDNPWNNALDRAKRAGAVLAAVLMERNLGVRPITLIGFSLGARVIFYALIELAKQKAFGIVQDVFLLGTTVTASTKTWCETRSVVSGRYVNAYAKNDWVLNYLFRATSGGLNTVAGLRPVEDVPGLENVEVTDKISGHMSYRTFMPLILDQLGFPVSADFFDEPEEPDFEEDRIVVREGEPKKKGWFSRKQGSSDTLQKVSRPPTASSFTKKSTPPKTDENSVDEELPPRLDTSTPPPAEAPPAYAAADAAETADSEPSELPRCAGFDFKAIKEMIGKAEVRDGEIPMSPVPPVPVPVPPVLAPSQRSESMPPPYPSPSPAQSSSSPLDSTPNSKAFTSQFTRSLSLGEHHGVDEPAMSESTFSPVVVEASQSTPRPLISPSLVDNVPWSPPAQSNTSMSTLPTESSYPFSGYTAASGLNLNRSSSAVPSTSTNDLYADLFTPTGMSFGGPDGLVTIPSVADPWSSRTDEKKSLGFNANPWS